MNLLLDIDGVLINWEAPITALEKSTGFNDFSKVYHQSFNHLSQDQLCLIDELFGDCIRWLTTWEIGWAGESANKNFCSRIGWPARDTAVWPLGPEIVMSPEPGIELNWWKAGVVNDLLYNDHEFTQGKVVWVDDELENHWYEVKPMLERHNALDRFRCIAPWPVWSRKDIEDAYEWSIST